MTYYMLDNWWWPYIFILVAGWLATDIWRWLGVLVGNRLEEGSLGLLWVRAIATSIIAAIIAKLIIYPTGSLLDFDIVVRIGAVIIGFIVFIYAKKRIIAGVVTSLACLFIGNWWLV
ncbi:MAG: AzlD domain-containing protein [Lentilitoribacter sp.]